MANHLEQVLRAARAVTATGDDRTLRMAIQHLQDVCIRVEAEQANPPISPVVPADLAPPRVAITVSSGFISVYSDKEVAVRVIDYDTDGSDLSKIRTVRFSDGDTRDGLVFDHADEYGIDPEWIDQLFALEPSE